MKFFFPDSQDQIDPTFDFVLERSSPDRVRQRDDRYAHEVLTPAPYDGILLSKALVDGPGRYTFAQRHRLYRLGLRRFFRLDEVEGERLSTLGDCGAFNYVREEEPPYPVEEVFDFYEECGFDMGVSVDHVILAFVGEADDADPAAVQPEWRARQELTLDYAAEFLRLHRTRGGSFVPLGVAQGWSPSSYAEAVATLQRMGYSYIALGGMVPLKTRQILACLRAIEDVRQAETRLHLLGVTRTESIDEFARFGVASFDSTSPFRQSFKDATDNYYTRERNYTAIRVMQIDANMKLKRRVLAGELDQVAGRRLEEACLERLREYDGGSCSVDSALDALAAYDAFLGEPDRRAAYEETLAARPWEECPCAVCGEAGIDVVVFRGTERNKRRGFHNLAVFADRIRTEIGVPA
jgi:hypothetical protein